MTKKLFFLLIIFFHISHASTIIKESNSYSIYMNDAKNIVNVVVSQNLWNSLNSTASRSTSSKKISNIFYKHFHDDFDFVMLINNSKSIPNGLRYAGFSIRTKVDTKGIGFANNMSITSSYGSKEKLRSLIVLTLKDALKGGPSLHEIFHHWGNYYVPTDVSGHWGYLGSGSKTGGQLGGFAMESLQSLGGNRYKANCGAVYGDGTKKQFWGKNANSGNGVPYSEIELYMMGLIPSDQVPTMTKFSGVQMGQQGEFTANSKTKITIESLINKHGKRIPTVENSQKSFRAVAVMISKTKMSDSEMKAMGDDVENFSQAKDDGLNWNYNFWEATKGLATINMSNLNQSLIDSDFRVTTTVKGKGKITPEFIKVKAGENTTFQFLADSGYQFSHITIDNDSISNLSPFELTNITSDTAFVAVFKEIPTTAVTIREFEIDGYSLLIAPSPLDKKSNGKLFIKAEESEVVTLTLKNRNGTIIATKKLENSEKEFVEQWKILKDITPGIYYILLNVKNRTKVVKRLIKL